MRAWRRQRAATKLGKASASLFPSSSTVTGSFNLICGRGGIGSFENERRRGRIKRV